MVTTRLFSKFQLQLFLLAAMTFTRLILQTDQKDGNSTHSLRPFTNNWIQQSDFLMEKQTAARLIMEGSFH